MTLDLDREHRVQKMFRDLMAICHHCGERAYFITENSRSEWADRHCALDDACEVTYSRFDQMKLFTLVNDA
uniref:Uncharacterized protein n=1 Tax=uncultured prokaryote TaxID=198431 RepID=A0A0H5QPM1_9ZZZZ|nr:hypothetical protein [uncultured prokaryote]